MQILNSPATLLTRYAALRAEAEALDQSEQDLNPDVSCVNIKNITETTDSSGTVHSWIRRLYSWPETDDESKGLKVSHSVTESERYVLARTVDGQKVSTETLKSTTYVDDGTTLKVTESMSSFDDDFFLAKMEQTYLISKTSGKIEQLESKASAPFEAG